MGSKKAAKARGDASVPANANKAPLPFAFFPQLATLVEHRTDLAACLDRLLAECERGEAYFKIYRQFKMYNDPSLNPALYGELKGG